MALVVERGGQFLVRQRPSGVVNAHLWEFPNLELEIGAAVRPAARRLGWRIQSQQPWYVVNHSITRFRIRLEVFLAAQVNGRDRPDTVGQWRSLEQLEAMPFTAAHRRIVRALQRGGTSTAVGQASRLSYGVQLNSPSAPRCLVPRASAANPVPVHAASFPRCKS